MEEKDNIVDVESEVIEEKKVDNTEEIPIKMINLIRFFFQF